jgi:uncharacterized protein YjbI with pentapeptide repeats
VVNYLRVDLVADALNIAIYNRRPAPGLNPDSDRSSPTEIPELFYSASETTGQHASFEQNPVSAQEELRADIQAILDVLRRLQQESVPTGVYVKIDLQRTKLSKAYLIEANLSEALLMQVILTKAAMNS